MRSLALLAALLLVPLAAAMPIHGDGATWEGVLASAPSWELNRVAGAGRTYDEFIVPQAAIGFDLDASGPIHFSLVRVCGSTCGWTVDITPAPLSGAVVYTLTFVTTGTADQPLPPQGPITDCPAGSHRCGLSSAD